MRIISSFHDYYDGVQSQGQDMRLIYLRNEKILEIHLNDFPSTDSNYYYDRDYDWQSYGIGFCGQVYPVVRVEAGPKRIFAYSIGEIDSFLEQELNKKKLSRYYDTDRWGGPGRHSTFAEYFKKAELVKANYGRVFEDNKSPIFVERPSSSKRYGEEIVLNAQLKDYEFFRKVDPYTAYQEISMFLGSMAMPEKQIPEVSDKDLIEAKGFDKYSFRKEPSRVK